VSTEHSDFQKLTAHLDFCRTSHVVFKAGKNWDSYFDNDDLVKQVKLSMDILEEKNHGFKKALFLFDNATTHQKWAPNAPSARKMLKGPKLGWTRPGGPKTRDTILPDGSIQSFYFLDDHPSMPGWFKGMKVGSNLTESARILNAPKDRQPAAATVFYSTNQTSLVWNHILKRLSWCMATYVIFTLNFTAN
jgi:hypothetical protein